MQDLFLSMKISLSSWVLKSRILGTIMLLVSRVLKRYFLLGSVFCTLVDQCTFLQIHISNLLRYARPYSGKVMKTRVNQEKIGARYFKPDA